MGHQTKDGRFVGFKRVVTEYLPAGGSKWGLDPLEFDPEANIKLCSAARGIENLSREKIGPGKHAH